MGPLVRFLVAFSLAQTALSVPILYTETSRYDPAAAGKGGERFPNGAAIQMFSEGRKHLLVAGFAATADATVSFDGARVVFAAKRKGTDPWQIWEIALSGGVLRCIVCGKDRRDHPFLSAGGSDRVFTAGRRRGFSS